MQIKNSRLKKLEDLRSSGVDPYPRVFNNRISIDNLLTEFNVAISLKEFNKIKDNKYSIAGRVLQRRDHGQNIFFDLMDQSGEIQLHAHLWTETDKNVDGLRLNIWDKIQECDLGDMIGVSGTLGANPRGKPLFQITDWTLLAKALIEPPDKHHGISDPEVKYRHRERDLISSAESRVLFKTRAEIIFEIRKYLNDRDYIEIEAPILQPIYGGATAKPFITHHNSLSQDFFLSISSELYLKRALVGGFDRVYSISRCFRNEGISPTHNPEFTNLEIFETCKTADDMKQFTIGLWDHLYKDFNSNKSLPPFQFISNMLSKDWPLSRIRKDSVLHHESMADAWELLSGDIEIASGASDLNNPREQESRLKESESTANKYSRIGPYEEFDPYDQNYIEALECGLLPVAGVGIGIDRLVMLLTGQTNIRDAILFPTLKSLHE